MKKQRLTIEIVSSTHKILSSMSEKSRTAVLSVLQQHYSDVRVTIINTLEDLEALAARKPDLVFLGMKFIFAEPQMDLRDSDKIWLSEFLDAKAITYTGSGKLANQLESDKPLAKQRAIDSGLATSAYTVVTQGQKPTLAQINPEFPVFIKPTNRGGGLGVDSDSVANTLEQIHAKVSSLATKYGADSLIEHYLPGREISVAILQDQYNGEFSLMSIERIVPPDEHGARILSPQVKHADAGLSVKVTDAEVVRKVTSLALDVFLALGARDYGRIDIRFDEYGNPQFLEANLIPSIIEGYGNFPKACVLNLGLDYETMILRIVELALKRADSLQQSNIARITAV